MIHILIQPLKIVEPATTANNKRRLLFGMSQITMNHLKYILRLPGKIVEASVEQCDHKSDLNYLPTQRRARDA